MIIVTTDISCDGCGNWEHFKTGYGPRRRAARKYFRSQGWHSIQIDGKLNDLCPRCYAKLQAEQKGTRYDDANFYRGP